MNAPDLRSNPIAAAGAAGPGRRAVFAGCALAATALVLAQALPGQALGQDAPAAHIPLDLPDAAMAARQAAADIGSGLAPFAAVAGKVPDTAATVVEAMARPAAAGDGNATPLSAAERTAALGVVDARALGTLTAPGAAGAHVQVHTDAIATASGTVATVDFYGDGLINFAVDPATGVQVAPGAGRDAAPAAITMSAADASAVVDRAVNMSGVTLPRAVAIRDGGVALVAETAVQVVQVVRANRSDPLVTQLGEAGFRPGADTRGVATDHGPGTAADAEQAARWSRTEAALFGVVAGVGGGPSPAGVAGLPQLLVTPLPVDTLSLVRPPGDPDPEPGQSEALAAVVATLARIESLVGTDRLAASDVCQVAGGGAGQAGCSDDGRVDDLPALEPAGTGAACTLTSGAVGIRLSCGGAAQPRLSGPFDLPTPAIDSTTTLLDMMELWLGRPIDPSLAVVPMSARAPQLANAALPLDPVR